VEQKKNFLINRGLPQLHFSLKKEAKSFTEDSSHPSENKEQAFCWGVWLPSQPTLKYQQNPGTSTKDNKAQAKSIR
jgi:hypothetical protein